MAVVVGGTAAGAAADTQPSGWGSSGGAGIGAPTPSTNSSSSQSSTAPAPKSTPLHPVVPGMVAKIIHGVAYAPADAPPEVQQAIWAGDRIRRKPYMYGGGHGRFNDVGYDCSGTVSYVLHAAGLLQASMDSSGFMSWEEQGAGEWITVYTNPGHAFIEIAGIRLDTSAEGDPHPARGSGPRWRPLLQDTSAFAARHPIGL